MKKGTILITLIILTGCYVSGRIGETALAMANTLLYPGTSVYYVEGDTLYYYGGVWYLFDNGKWYSGRTSNGPWRNISPADVPSDVLDVHTMRFPPPTVFVEEKPPLIIYPGTNVYYWSDGHLYRFGGFWYLYIDGIWYRSLSYTGPWLVIRVREVPRPVIKVYRERPRRKTRVEYLPNAYIYQYRGKWYYYRNGRWYVGKTWRGPWRIVRRGAPDIVIRTHRHRVSKPPRKVIQPRRIEPPKREKPPRNPLKERRRH